MADDDKLLQWLPQQKRWLNWHETIGGKIAGVHVVHYPADRSSFGSEAINRCTVQIRRAMADARRKERTCRAVGRGWSLSDVNLTDGALIDISRLNGMMPLTDELIDPAFSGDRAGLWLIQGGAYLSEVNRRLESDRFGRSLPTSGAANGQTIAGATATGTHGSALGVGALHDQIVAIHLLAGPDRQYWLEREKMHVIDPSVPAALGATLKRTDDRLFNAVLVGLGAFGIVHNVVLATRERFLLDARSHSHDAAGRPLVLDAAMRHVIATLDFAGHPLLKPPAGLGKPYFFQPIVDPSTDPPGVLVTQMFELPWRAGYQPDYRMAEASFGPGYDFISTLGRLLDVFKPGVPLVAQIAGNLLFNTMPRIGSWGELFGHKTPRTKVASGSVAVALPRALDALDALIALNRRIGPVPLVFGCRYVWPSDALLAMNRFDPVTFVISLDGVWNKSSLRFFDAVPAAMDAAGIEFTQHWGKTNGYTAERVRTVFRGDYGDWIAARHELLPDPDDRAMFTNAYMRERGLDA